MCLWCDVINCISCNCCLASLRFANITEDGYKKNRFIHESTSFVLRRCDSAFSCCRPSPPSSRVGSLALAPRRPKRCKMPKQLADCRSDKGVGWMFLRGSPVDRRGDGLTGEFDICTGCFRSGLCDARPRRHVLCFLEFTF